MKLIEFPKFKNYTNQKVNFIQPKLDGHLTKIYKGESHLWQAYTKNNKVISDKLISIKHIEAELADLPCNSQIFAELHCPGVHATSVPTMLNEANEDLQLTVFAAPLLDNVDCFDRNLISIMEQLNSLGINVSFATLVKHDFINKAAQEILLKQAAKKKREGWVLKEGHMTGWYKLKPVKTIDAFVIGTYQSFSSTHYGGLQAIHIAVYKPDGTIHDLGHVGSGFTLPYRKSLNTKIKRDTLIGKVCVIEFDKVGMKGGLRFPRMAKDDNDNVIWRTDKDPKQCTTEQLE